MEILTSSFSFEKYFYYGIHSSVQSSKICRQLKILGSPLFEINPCSLARLIINFVLIDY